MMSRACVIGPWLLGLFLALGGNPASADPLPATCRLIVRVEGGHLSAALAQAPAGQVFERIAKEGRFVLTLDPSFKAIPLSSQISEVELEEGLRRLIGFLGPSNVRMDFVEEDGVVRLEQVAILAGSGPGVAQGAPSVQGGLPRGLSRKLERGETLPDRPLPRGLQEFVQREGKLPEGYTKLPPGLQKQWKNGKLPYGIQQKLERASRFSP